ncbi:CrcB family protein [Paenibacillus sp. IB182496]|uniref:Fluoride-specific ion channel FluC n=1 Tax=Paenibacillus sabuli TaxID=2772509 RepID=A0A927GSF2_9BACL|nr:CrcB family protein [Paenibacillus sabuli]MBD2846226.1 CrcB family protein [Paenibacillus sabuli]
MTGLLLAAGGGAIGAVARYGIGLWCARYTSVPQAATLLVNLLGSALLGVLLGWTAGHPHPMLYAWLGTGMMGGFTTYSTLMVQLVNLRGKRLTLTWYAAATFLGGPALFALGMLAGALF